jgi:SAM-dependent methyltransferase
MPHSEAARSCRLCGGTELAFVFAQQEGFALSECAACGLVATTPELPASELGRWYAPAYYGERNRRFNPLFEWLIRLFRARRARAIEKFVRSGRILDVGCGRGLLPALLRKRGWEAHGTEISVTAAAHARQLGIPVFVGDLTASPYPPESFDVAVFWHVLEHMADPRAALRKAHEILRPGALLAVAVPNFESLQARATGPSWFHLDVPRHYFHFRLRVLRRLLESEGFSILRVSHFSFEQNPYGWIQSLYNRAGFRHNLLYEILKHESARSGGHPVRTHPVQTLLTLLTLPVVAPLSLVLFLLEVLLRRGGTVEIYARRT